MKRMRMRWELADVKLFINWTDLTSRRLLTTPDIGTFARAKAMGGQYTTNMSCVSAANTLYGSAAANAIAAEALDRIEFARGSPNSTWGSIQAAMGHPEPFDLKYVTTGNEDCGKPYYRATFTAFSPENEAFVVATFFVENLL
nr:alpha-L-arabinofuranosidase 1 [Tanacetum cinerariifolium]